MRRGRSHPVCLRPPAAGFTLIELLVVMAIISVLLAVTLPVLHRMRAMAYRVTCGSNLQQIATAWHAYLADNNQQFLQEVSANHYFGGWQGIVGPARRPLNKHVGLPMESPTREDAELFRCPADKGDEDYGPVAYLHYGNSYQTNLMLIGPDSLPDSKWVPASIGELHGRINEHLKNLKADAICDPSRLLLVGDNNWMTQWEPLLPTTLGRPWHRAPDWHHLAFFDGHIALVEIHKGIYLDSDYRVQPFKELDTFTVHMQSQIVQNLYGGP